MNYSNFKLYILVAVLSMAIFGCEKDKATVVEKSNAFKFGDETIETPKGYLIDYGYQTYQSRDYDLILCSSTVSYVQNHGYVGEGQVVYLDLNSPSLEGLESGVYTFNAATAIRRPNLLSTVNVFMAVQDEDTEDNSFYSDEYSTGSVTITKTNDVYEIVYMITFYGETLEGYYKGKLIL